MFVVVAKGQQFASFICTYSCLNSNPQSKCQLIYYLSGIEGGQEELSVHLFSILTFPKLLRKEGGGGSPLSAPSLNHAILTAW